MVETGCKLGLIGNYKGKGVSEASICIEKYEPKLTISRSFKGGDQKTPCGKDMDIFGNSTISYLVVTCISFLITSLDIK